MQPTAPRRGSSQAQARNGVRSVVTSVLAFADIRSNYFEQVTNDPHDDRQCETTDKLWKDGISCDR